MEGGVNRGWSMATEGGENSVQDLKKLWRADLVCVKGCEGVVRCGRGIFCSCGCGSAFPERQTGALLRSGVPFSGSQFVRRVFDLSIRISHDLGGCCVGS